MDGKTYVPQHRERIMIVAFDRRMYNGTEEFSFPEQKSQQTRVRDILQEEADPKYTLSDKLLIYLQNYAIRRKANGNGFGFIVIKRRNAEKPLRQCNGGRSYTIPAPHEYVGNQAAKARARRWLHWF